MKLALRIAGVVCLALAGWWWFARASSSTAVSAVEPVAHETAAKPESAAVELQATSEPAHVEVPAAEDSRAATPTPEPVVVTKDTQSTTTCLLRVHVVARETRKPLAGQRVVVIPKGDDHGGWKNIKGSHAAIGVAPLTDADGRAELEVEPGHELNVHTGDFFRDPISIAALTTGETRDVDVDIPTEPDRAFFGRLVDGETKQAIANGVIWCEGSSMRFESSRADSDTSAGAKAAIPGDAIRSRADGTFQLKVRSWEQKFANARADGYSRVVFTIDASHAAPDGALEVRLSRSATLVLALLDGARAVANAKIDLTTDAYQLQQRGAVFDFYSGQDPHWSARTDTGGRAEVAGLPPRVPLKLSIRAPGHDAYHHGEPLSLDPGERRDLNIALGSGASIVGRIENSSGTPLVGCELWRLAAQAPMAKLLESYEKPVATTRSDDQGRFRFDDVAAGTWLVGPKPEDRWNREAKTPTAMATLGEPVVIEANMHQIEIVLRVDVGLYVRGSVVDPAGAPIKETSVTARRATSWVHVNDRSDESGQFMLGPLPAGAYAVEAETFRGEFAKSESVNAQAGDSDIVLRLRVGGAIRGRVVDATQQRRECDLTLTREAEDSGWMMTTSKNGSLVFNGLLPGTYSVSAKTSDGLWGRRSGLVVRAGETKDDVEIVVEPGARLTLRYAGEAVHCSCDVYADGVPVGGDRLERGNQLLVAVPAGEVEVRWSTDEPNAKHSQRVTLRAGEEREVVWDGKP